MTATRASLVVAALLLLPTVARAQLLRFPSTTAQHQHFYPTAYYDHGGLTDWNCGNDTYTDHHGNDYGVGSWTGMDEGRDVVAASDGVVTAAHDGEFDRCSTGDCAGGGGWGNHVFLQHPDGKTTIYAHFKQWSVAVAVNDVVTCGQLLGQVGSSGYSTGPHLHFEVRNVSNSHRDPFLGNCSPNGGFWVVQGAYQGVPEPVCPDSWPGCVPEGTLLCGDALSTRNDGPGSSQTTGYYGCSEFSYSGPERVWRFATTLDESVTLSMTGLGADLDLYVLEDTACDGSGCLEASSNSDLSDEEVVFDAVAGTEYVVVVDGWEGATSDFTLTVGCEGGDPFATPDAGVPPADAAVVTADASVVTADASPTGDDEGTTPSGVRSGCACGTGGPGDVSAALLLVLLLLGLAVRRRAVR